MEGPGQDLLFSNLYQELRALARRELRNRALPPMGPTTLVHETYLNIAGRAGVEFENREHFLGYATRTMRGLIVDRVRRRACGKHGGGVHVSSLDTALGEQLAAPEEVLRVGGLMDELATLDAELAQVVDLKFFCGFTFVEIASILACSDRTAQRYWDEARMLLRKIAHDTNGLAQVL
jgi:RNA polymerase sigma factor (TIGR02999 family)